MKDRKPRLTVAVALILSMILVIGVGLMAAGCDQDIEDIEAQAGVKTSLGWAVAKRLTVQNQTEAQGPVTISGNLVNEANVTIDDVLKIDDNTLTITGTQTLTPTASIYLLAPSSTLTLTISTGSADTVDFLWLVNTVATSTIVVDTGATAGGGDRTLGLNDIIGFTYANSKWIESFYSDNS